MHTCFRSRSQHPMDLDSMAVADSDSLVEQVCFLAKASPDH